VNNDAFCQSTGGEGERWWFLNGEPLEGRNYNYSLKLYLPGEYQLMVMDETGQTATVNFEMAVKYYPEELA
jgi:penicillin-binding protein 1C